MKAYLSLAEAAEILGYSSGAVIKDYIHKGYMFGERIGKFWVVTPQEVERRKRQITRYHTKRLKKLEAQNG